MPESRDQRIRRLIYRSAYTGTRETDKLLGAFAREFLPVMDDAELTAYEDMLNYGDPDIWGWTSGQVELPDDINNSALDRLIAWVRSNPAL